MVEQYYNTKHMSEQHETSSPHPQQSTAKRYVSYSQQPTQSTFTYHVEYHLLVVRVQWLHISLFSLLNTLEFHPGTNSLSKSILN